jgi:hypothetical protein
VKVVVADAGYDSESNHQIARQDMGSSLRARTPETREMEMRLRVLTHNIMLLANLKSDGRN